MNQPPQNLEARKHRARETIRKTEAWATEVLQLTRRIPAHSIAAEEAGFIKKEKPSVVLAKDRSTLLYKYDTVKEMVEDGWRPDI